MTDRHRTKPMSLRLPEALSAWIDQQARETGKPKRRIILDAIEAAKATQHDGAAKDGRST